MREVRAGCDKCNWAGDSSRAARSHHDATGHTTWAETKTVTFYGDPMEQWLKEAGMTRVPTPEVREP